MRNTLSILLCGLLVATTWQSTGAQGACQCVPTTPGPITTRGMTTPEASTAGASTAGATTGAASTAAATTGAASTAAATTTGAASTAAPTTTGAVSTAAATTTGAASTAGASTAAATTTGAASTAAATTTGAASTAAPTTTGAASTAGASTAAATTTGAASTAAATTTGAASTAAPTTTGAASTAAATTTGAASTAGASTAAATTTGAASTAAATTTGAASTAAATTTGAASTAAATTTGAASTAAPTTTGAASTAAATTAGASTAGAATTVLPTSLATTPYFSTLALSTACVCPPGYVQVFGTASPAAQSTVAPSTAAPTTRALVDECALGTDNCHADATCVDSDPHVGFSCTCNAGYQGNGTYCEDTDECVLSPSSCGSHTTCANLVGSFRCDCMSGFEPLNATHCTDINECTLGVSGCSDICNNTDGSFACDCPAFFKLDVADNKTCVAARSCDTSNPCSPSDVSTCAVTDSGYTCGCNSGYKLADGSQTLCVNVDECATGENNCDPTLGMCTDNAGGFTCSCKAGYTGAGTIGACTDVDECAAGTAVCDPNANCVNTVGAYTCSCDTGYKSIATNGTGFPGECKEDRLFPFGANAGDMSVTGSVASDKTSSLIKVPDGLPLFGGRLCDTLYVLENGLVVATTLKETQDSVAKTIYRHPTTDAAAFGDPVCAVFAPFWADAVVGGEYPSKVWYHYYQKNSGGDDAMLQTIDELTMIPGFNATFALLVTYETMAMAGETARPDMETNTFQGGIITDGVHTFAGAIYEDGGMKWDPQITDSNLVGGKWPAFVGIVVESANGSLIVVENENSRMKTKLANGAKDCSGTNVYCMDSRATEGVWSQADDNADGWVNPRKWCTDWYNAEPAVSAFASAVPCPLTKAHADLDTRFKAASDVSTGGRACYEQNDGSSFTNGGNSLCCYGASDGAFMLNNRELSGNVHRYARSSQNYQDHDVKPRQYCCQDTSSAYCTMYFEKRPMISSDGYEAPQQSAGAGDPHITTLDGFSYSFNGYDEYLMGTNTSDAPRVFQMQGRTKLADVEPGKVPLATVFSGIAVKQPTNDVQIYLNGTGTSVDIYVDSTAYTHAGIDDGSTDSFSDGRFQLVKDSSTSAVTGVKVIFTSGISVEVKAGLGMLTYAVSMTPDMKSKLKGLLGNFNGNNQDEFFWPNGTAVSFTNATNPPEDELFAWGQSWALRTTGDSTLFTVYPDGENAATYGNSSFTPLFFNLDTMFPNETDKARAISVCGGADKKECLFDIALTGNEEVGAAAAAALDAVANSNAALSNTPPVFNVTSEIRATVGQEYGLQLEATDDGSVTITVAQGPGSLNGSNYYTWTPSDTSNYTIQFLATDDVGASTSQTPDVTVCACQNGGTCNFATTLTARSAGFAIAACNCQLGFVGDYCETDYNGCSVTPCYPGVNCTDAVAPLSPGAKEYTCASCPAGMVGDGESCVDLNECLLPSNNSNVHQCKNATCFNEAPGYRCECLSGYSMLADNRTCVDIDECATGADNCHADATCTNTEGSFTCACNTGYSGDGTTCSDIDECQTNNGGCAQVCTNNGGSFLCSCNAGYQLNADGMACDDIDECALGTDTCSHSCVNTGGAYNCTCPDGLKLDLTMKNCIPESQCLVKNCTPSGIASCAVINSVETCLCADGYEANDTMCVDVNECATMCKGTNMKCNNTVGSYMCSCAAGFVEKTVNGSMTCEETKAFSGSIRITSVSFTPDLADTSSAAFKTLAASVKSSLDTMYSSQLGAAFQSTTVTGFTNGSVVTAYTVNMVSNSTVNSTSLAAALQAAVQAGGAGGFSFDASSITVADIDECAGENSCHAQATCTNTEGSYTCTCNNGYTDNSATGAKAGSSCEATQTEEASNSQTLAIALGVTFGILGLAIIMAIIVMVALKSKKGTATINPEE
ncbi:PREDICTED: mucin-like protein isoform X2 [Branchiostoma belcheri]|uniref:Mucin-like protein isoform X2 n=1 Tax=Branchiostoma belcheri TaxID=7741 RepID=A0A6P4YUB8_BRABE|nr:PREDICTED: mucin-like protein isoform X2 [Branchiostoma belcheri]